MNRILLAAAIALAIATPFHAVAAPAADAPFTVRTIAKFDEPWAMSFLPDGTLLVTQKQGALKRVARDGTSHDVTGVPAVDYGGQGGLADVVVHPGFAENSLVYLSYAEAGEGDLRGAAVARGKLALDAAGGGALSGVEVIWRQEPKKSGRGHYGHRIAFGEGKLWITSGDRQEFDPAQDMKANLGKILRLNEDGSVPTDNPFVDQGGVAAQVWTLGHRNPLGIAFQDDGTLWTVEMGPKDGDELNRIERGSNYGYPIVSNGDHYDGRDIPDHDTRPEFNAPEITWTPVISPGGFIIYSGDGFPAWKGNGLVASLSGKALVRIAFDGHAANEVERYEMRQRIREVEQGPDGKVFLLQDSKDGAGGRLLELTPRN